jgi:hypothetical protein
MKPRNSHSQRKTQSQFKVILPATLTACMGLAGTAIADPLPGEALKFYQSPLNGGGPGVYPVGATPLATDTPAPFLGHDELSTATTSPSGGSFNGSMMADDFLDTNPNPISHITFWGSYMNGTDPGPTGAGIGAFQITLYTDIPAVGTPGSPNFQPSHPGNIIATQKVVNGPLAPSSGSFTSKLVPPNGPGVMQPGDSPLYEFNAELNWRQITFPDADALNTTVADPVEWLSIVALSPFVAGQQTLLWGWHDRDYGISDPFAPPGSETNFPYHMLDDAVSNGVTITSAGGVAVGAYNATNYISAYDGISSSKDLAFALYYNSVPEPTSAALLVIAAPALLSRRARRKS